MARQIEIGSARILTPREVYQRLDRYVIGQERAKRAVAIAAYNHQKRIALRRRSGQSLVKKSNVLLIGPTGSGKTHIARHLARILEVPFVVVDATEFTEAGYYGKDVESMISDLLSQANQDVHLAQRGIVFIDEVDKIARRSQGARTGAGTRDIGGEGVQQALLKLLEGREVYAPLNANQHWSRHDFVPVDTSDILFVCAGTFSDLQGWMDDRAVGFSRPATPGMPRRKRIRHQELIEYGMLAEFLGRLPVVVQLAELSRQELREILVDPPDAIVREYRELLSTDEIDLWFTDEALDAVVAWAADKRLGARALRSILEEVMAEVMFEAPERAGERVEIDGDLVRRRLSYLDEGTFAGA